MILCHKCSGILTATETENLDGLSLCCCISGYVRGFEPIVDRLGAIAAQIKESEDNIRVYTYQGRPEVCIEKEKLKIAHLKTL